MTLVETPWSPERYLGQTEAAADTRWIFYQSQREIIKKLQKTAGKTKNINKQKSSLTVFFYDLPLYTKSY